MKKILCLLTLIIGLGISTFAQNYTITDHSGYISFRAADSTSVSDIDKDNIISISVISSTEARVVVEKGISSLIQGTSAVGPGSLIRFNEFGYYFDIDYNRWSTNGDSSFYSVSSMVTWLNQIRSEDEYYHQYTNDGTDITSHTWSWIYNSDTVQVQKDTMIYDSGVLQEFYKVE